MDTIEKPYTREDAIEDGRLFDVSHLNRGEFNPYPTYVSAGLWQTCHREQQAYLARRRRRAAKPKPLSQDELIRQAISLVPLIRWLERGKHGQFTMYFHSNKWLRYPLPLRVVIEPDD